MVYCDDLLKSAARVIARHRKVTVDMAHAYIGSLYRAWVGDVDVAEAYDHGGAILRACNKAGYVKFSQSKDTVSGIARFRGMVSRTPVAPGDQRPAVSMRDSEVLADADVLNHAMWRAGEVEYTTHKPTANVLRELKASGVWTPSKEEDSSVNWHCKQTEGWYLAPFADWRGRIYLQSGSHGSPMTDHVNRGCTDFATGQVASIEDSLYVAAVIKDEYGLDHEGAVEFLTDPVEYCRTHGVPQSLGNFTRAAWALREMANGVSTGYIVQQDASCSGFQIMSLLTGDEELARQVNLLSPTKEYDLYTHVAEAAGIFTILSEMGIDQRFARHCAKAVVMLVGYGAGVDTVAEGILKKGDDIELDHELAVISSTFGGVRLSILDATQLAQAGVDTLFDMFPGLEHLKRCAQKWAKQSGGTEWVSPSGLHCVKNDIGFDPETGRAYVEDGAAGALPNLVHSVDGAIAARVITTFDGNIVTIHDSFGAGVADARKVRRCVAEAYLWAVSEFDAPFQFDAGAPLDTDAILNSALVA